MQCIILHKRKFYLWFKLYFNCYKYEHIIAENIKYPGSDKKPNFIFVIVNKPFAHYMYIAAQRYHMN